MKENDRMHTVTTMRYSTCPSVQQTTTTPAHLLRPSCSLQGICICLCLNLNLNGGLSILLSVVTYIRSTP